MFTFSLFLTACFDQAAEDSANGLVSGHQSVQNKFTVYLSANKTYTANETIEVILNHPFNVNVTGTPRIEFDLGGNTEYFNYIQGNGTKILIFSYSVQSGDIDLDGIDINSFIDLNGGELKFSSQGQIEDAETQLGNINSSSILVDAFDPLSPAQLVVTTEPTNAYVNEVISPAITVELRDASNNLVTSATEDVTLNFATDPSGGSAIISGTTTVTPINGVAIFNDIQIDTVNNGYEFEFTASGLSNATSSSFNITNPPAEDLAIVAQPTNTVAGENISPAITVEILDALGNRDTSASDTITLAFNNNAGSGTLNGTLSVAAVNGLATFSDINIEKVGVGYTLDATASGLTTATTNPFNITAAAKASLAFVTQPSDTENNSNITPAMTVEILDAYGNRTEDTDSIALSINNNPSAGSLSGTITVAAVDGLANFSDIQIDNAGTGYTLDATATGLTSDTSDSFDITSTPSQLVITTQPTDTVKDVVMSPSITVEIRDAANNIVNSATNSVTLAFASDPSSGSAVLTGTVTKNAVAGVVTFNDINIDTVNDNYSFSFTSTGLTSATSDDFNIEYPPATQLSFTTQPSDALAGEVNNPDIIVEVQDSTGNLVPTASDDITLSFSNNAGSGTLSGTLTVSAVNGVATFNDISIDKAATGYTLAATAPGLSNDISNSFEISANTKSQLVFSTQPTDTDQGTIISPDITVEIHDAYGNITADTDTISIAINNNPSGGVLAGTSDIAAVAGVATFNDLEIDAAGVGYTLNATATGLTLDTSDSFDINAVVPTVTLDALDDVSLANHTSYTISGTCSEDGEDVDIAGGGANLTVSCNAGIFSTGAIDVSSLADDQNLEITADHSNAGGTPAIQATQTIIKDTVQASIDDNDIADATYGISQTLSLQIDFDEIVTVTGTPRIELFFNAQSAGNIYAEYTSGSNSTTLIFEYTIAAGDSDSDGINIDTSIDLNSGTIVDQVGNAATLSFTPTNYTNVLVDSDVPSIVEFIEPVNGTYPENVDLNFQVNFDEAVIVTGTPRLVINVGGNTRYATYASGSGTAGLEFAYTVQSGESDLDGITMNSNSIDLNSGSIKDAGGGDAALDFSLYLNSMTSVLVDANTGITPPDQVTGLATAPTSSNTTLALSWSVPNDNGTAITHYVVQYREQGNSTWINHSPNPTFNSTSINGLSEGVTYEFRVAANNGLLGPFSNTATAEIFDIASLNPIAWLSATDISNGGAEPNHNDKIASWSDLSGVASPATEANPANQPTYHTNAFNGLPAVRFDGHSTGLEGTFTRVNNNGLTVFLVAKMDANNPRKCLFEFYSDNGNANDHRGFFFTYGMNEADTNHNLDDTTLNLWTAYDTGTHTDLWENGQVVYSNNQNWQNKSTAFTGAGAYVLGDDQTSGDQFNGYIAEFLIFDDQLSPADQAKVETYLQNKWGTP
ncbi:MAG: hypothetical protein CME62_08185 [Halobacteriovoraceae bacterium]|nr:hypothetical protein [Halobacteriovoraceae bacterium]